MSDKKTDKKRELILTHAKQVFVRKGFTAVTMKDIVEECGISRGGIYLYFQSVDEVFMQVILMHNEQKLLAAQESIDADKSFEQLIDEYFNKQKNRLLHMHNSLLMAMHEYSFAHKDGGYKDFFYNQFLNTKKIILSLLSYGVQHKKLSDCNLEDLAVNIMFFIEGISTLAATSGVSEEIVDAQIKFVKNMIFHQKNEKRADENHTLL